MPDSLLTVTAGHTRKFHHTNHNARKNSLEHNAGVNSVKFLSQPQRIIFNSTPDRERIVKALIEKYASPLFCDYCKKTGQKSVEVLKGIFSFLNNPQEWLANSPIFSATDGKELAKAIHTEEMSGFGNYDMAMSQLIELDIERDPKSLVGILRNLSIIPLYARTVDELAKQAFTGEVNQKYNVGLKDLIDLMELYHSKPFMEPHRNQSFLTNFLNTFIDVGLILRDTKEDHKFNRDFGKLYNGLVSIEKILTKLVENPAHILAGDGCIRLIPDDPIQQDLDKITAHLDRIDKRESQEVFGSTF